MTFMTKWNYCKMHNETQENHSNNVEEPSYLVERLEKPFFEIYLTLQYFCKFGS